MGKICHNSISFYFADIEAFKQFDLYLKENIKTGKDDKPYLRVSLWKRLQMIRIEDISDFTLVLHCTADRLLNIKELMPLIRIANADDRLSTVVIAYEGPDLHTGNFCADDCHVPYKHLVWINSKLEGSFEC